MYNDKIMKDELSPLLEVALKVAKRCYGRKMALSLYYASKRDKKAFLKELSKRDDIEVKKVCN